MVERQAEYLTPASGLHTLMYRHTYHTHTHTTHMYTERENENFYSAKKHKIISSSEKWIEINIIILIEICQSHKYKYHMFSLICRI